MAYDSRIILAGQSPDIMGAVTSGNQAAAQTNALRTSNQLAELYRTQGAGILSGDQNALNALAGIDPNAALGIQGTQLGMSATRQNMAMAQEEMQMRRDQIKAEAERMAATMTAEQRAAEAAKIETGVKAASTATTPEQWDAIVTQFGVPDLVGQFGMKDALLTSYADVADILKGGDQAALGDRYKVVGGTLFDLGAEGGPRPVGEGSVSEEIIMGPDGKPIVVRGGAGTVTKFTEGQSKDNVYATRADGALRKLESPADPNDPNSPSLVDSLASLGESVAGSIPLAGNYLQSDAYQTAKTAGDEFLQAILRKDTGAAITPDEQALYGQTYLPQPGDLPERLAYKKEARRRALEAIKSGMMPAQLEAMARADAAVIASGASTQQPGASPAQPAPTQPQSGTKTEYVFNPVTGELE